jgi:hypothetical protein
MSVLCAASLKAKSYDVIKWLLFSALFRRLARFLFLMYSECYLMSVQRERLCFVLMMAKTSLLEHFVLTCLWNCHNLFNILLAIYVKMYIHIHVEDSETISKNNNEIYLLD